MKVRWTKNSLRLRITPGELAALEQGDAVREEIRLPGSEAAGWSAVIRPGALKTSLELQGCAVLVSLADCDLVRLKAPDAEGVYFQHETFRYYVEKDFPCIHPRAGDAMEEPTETFSNPAHFADRG